MPSSAAIAPKPVATLRPDGRHDQSHGGLQEQEQEIGLDSALGIAFPDKESFDMLVAADLPFLYAFEIVDAAVDVVRTFPCKVSAMRRARDWR